MEPTPMIEAIAEACHEANRAHCRNMGDNSQVPWADAPHWQRESAMDGVRAVMRGASSEELHESWCATKRADGWVYGEVKDADAKTHPCLIPYRELPAAQRAKDGVFLAVATALLQAVGELPVLPAAANAKEDK